MRIRKLSGKEHKEQGFTLVEMLISITIIVILFALSTVNIGQPQTTVNIASTVDTMLADIKSQQLKAMDGGVGSTTTQQPQGVYVQSNQYTLYSSATYNAGDSANYVVSLPQNVTLSTTFPSGKLLFNTGAGDVNSWASGSNTITITGGGVTKTITLGRFGATTLL